MDSTTLLIIGIVVALLAFYFYNRSRPAARGTYDDKSARSSGSIGGGTRAYDDETVRSSGSIGGGSGTTASGTRAYDAPEVESRGSIGGQPTQTRSETTRTTTTRSTSSGLKVDDDRNDELDNARNNDRDDNRLNDNRLKRLNDDDKDDQPQRKKGRANDDENFKSGGSFGSSN